MTILALGGLLAALFAVPGVAAAPGAEVAALKSCSTPKSFMVGPFFADQLRARGVSCKEARTVATRWGNCQFDGPRDRVCRVKGGYVCRYRDIPDFEGGRTTCRSGKVRAVGFRFGS